MGKGIVVEHTYVHYLEQNGVRTIPLNYVDWKNFDEILQKIDGVLLTGGNTNLTDFKKNTSG